jgi:hypothetical protein
MDLIQVVEVLRVQYEGGKVRKGVSCGRKETVRAVRYHILIFGYTLDPVHCI